MKAIIYPNFSKTNAFKTFMTVADELNRMGIEVLCDGSVSRRLDKSANIKFGAIGELASQCDIIIAIGGDGTILEASFYAAQYDKLLLGINTGRLGFMASMEADEPYKLQKLLRGEYTVENRMMLDCKYIGSEHTAVYTALNDVVISSKYAHLSDYRISSSGVQISSLRADGLIFSTPTGSTAYALSAGGPILEPSLECIEMTPVCPHTLVSRPMLFSADKVLEVSLDSRSGTELYLSIDGQMFEALNNSDRLIISRSDKLVKLIDISGNSFYNSVNSKLLHSIKDI